MRSRPLHSTTKDISTPIHLPQLFVLMKILKK